MGKVVPKIGAGKGDVLRRKLHSKRANEKERPEGRGAPRKAETGNQQRSSSEKG